MTLAWYITPQHYSIAEENNISPRTLEQRVRDNGWHIEKAISEPVRPRKTYGQWIKIAEQNGICSNTFRVRVNLYGWSNERAATEALMNRQEHMSKILKRQRNYPLSFIEQAEKNGICYNTFLSRMHRGWSMEEASSVRVKGARV